MTTAAVLLSTVVPKRHSGLPSESRDNHPVANKHHEVIIPQIPLLVHDLIPASILCEIALGCLGHTTRRIVRLLQIHAPVHVVF
jgi:hypothetical protein